jgi:hypothetical protein
MAGKNHGQRPVERHAEAAGAVAVGRAERSKTLFDDRAIRLESSATQGAAWNKLIKMYIAVIPVSSGEPGMAEQICAGPSEKPV